MKSWRERLPKLRRLIEHLEASYEGTDASILQLTYSAVAELDANDQQPRTIDSGTIVLS
jgi:hypothetical protein